MARWNQQPKYHIKNWSAYGYLQAQSVQVCGDLRTAANGGVNTETRVRIATRIIQRIAAMFIPVKDMSPAVKATIADQYKYAVFPTKVYLMQLDGKRVQVK